MLQALFMDGTDNWKLPSKLPSNGLSRIKYLKMIICEFRNLKHPQMYSYGGYQGIFNVT